MRYVRGLMEHKYFMNNRMNYLFHKGYLNNLDHLSISKKIYEMSETVFMLSLKYAATKKSSIINKIISILHDIINKESYLWDVINQLKNIQNSKNDTLYL